MKKVFIFSICGECDEPVGIIEPCNELGYNNFPLTNFHGELSIEETEQLRQELIQSLKDEGELDKANYIEKNTRVMEVTFRHISDVMVSSFDRLGAGIKKYGYNSKFRKEYESMTAQLRHDELNEFFDKWAIPNK